MFILLCLYSWKNYFLEVFQTTRSNHLMCSVKKVFLKISKKHLCRSRFFNNVTCMRIFKNTLFIEHLQVTAFREQLPFSTYYSVILFNKVISFYRQKEGKEGFFYQASKTFSVKLKCKTRDY